jgi:hypothetical protein
MSALGDFLLAASGSPIDHEVNDIKGELAGSRVRYQTAETEGALAKARAERAAATIAENKASTIPTLADVFSHHSTGSPEDRAAISAALIAAGGAPDASFAGANAYDTGNRDYRIAQPDTPIATTNRLLLANGKPLADSFAPVGPDMYYNKLEGTDPVRNPTVNSKIGLNNANAGLAHHKDTNPEDFRNPTIGSLPLDAADQEIVTKAQADGKLPPILPRAYATPALYHSLALTVSKNPNFTGADFKQMQDTEGRTNALAEKGGIMNFNSAIGHLNDFDEAAVQLQNGNNQPFNAIANRLGVSLEGKSQATALNETAALLSNELESTYVNNGGTEKGREKIHAAFQDINSPDQFATATETARSLLSERGLGFEQGYYAGRGTGNFRNRYLTPAARSVMNKYHPEQVTSDISGSDSTGNTGVVPGSEVHAAGAAGGASASARTPGAANPKGVATSANPRPAGGNSAATGVKTGAPTPNAAQLKMLQDHPELAPQFKAKFGFLPPAGK